MYKIEDLENKIICADCMDILKQLPDKCIDLVLTDPPYGGGDLWKNRKRSRFGGWFNKYHINKTVGLARKKEVQFKRGCL